MRTLIHTTGVVLMLLAIIPSVGLSKKSVRLHGQIVDVTGFTEKKEWDAETIRRGAEKGDPLGFYDTKAGRLYVVTLTDEGKKVNDELLPYVGERVYVTGTTYKKDGADYIKISKITTRARKSKNK